MDVGWVVEYEGGSTEDSWTRFSIIVYVTQAGMIRSERTSGRTRGRCAVDNICCITIQSRRLVVVVEGTEEIISFVHICNI